MPKEAKGSFETSLKVVKAIVVDKKAEIAADTDGKVVGKLLPEVQGLEELAPEIEEKIVEATKMNEDYVKMKATLASAFGLSGGINQASSGFEKPAPSDKPVVVNTLTAKRKTKPSNESPSKKPKS